MAVHWSPGFTATAQDGTVRRGAFLDDALHPELPADAIYIRPSRHAELMAQQATGARIESNPRTGRPIAVWPSVDQRREALLRAVKAEAGRRIEAISPLWRQFNDMREVSPEGAGRFAAIDEVRAASELIECEAAELDVRYLADFDIAAHPAWPQGNH